MYQRKTEDVFYIMANYGYGWDEVYCCDTFKEARETLKCYLFNEKNANFCITIKRIKKEILKK